MILKERMFRVKPYTKCLECIRTDHLKCKHCMEKIVDELAMTKDGFQTKQLILAKSPKSRYMLESKSPSQEKSISSVKRSLKKSASIPILRSSESPKQFEIHSKYELWMKHVNSKKDELKEQDPFKTMLKKWPLKKRIYFPTNDLTEKEIKFERWEQKFLDRIKSSKLKEQVENKRSTKTSNATLRI